MALLPRPDYSNGLLPWRCFLFAMGYGHGIATDLERAMGYCHGIAYYMRWATAMASLRGTTIFYYGRPRTRTGETSKNQHRQPWPQKATGRGGHEPEGHSPRGAVARARRPRTGRSRSGYKISLKSAPAHSQNHSMHAFPYIYLGGRGWAVRSP